MWMSQICEWETQTWWRMTGDSKQILYSKNKLINKTRLDTSNWLVAPNLFTLKLSWKMVASLRWRLWYWLPSRYNWAISAPVIGAQRCPIKRQIRQLKWLPFGILGPHFSAHFHPNHRKSPPFKTEPISRVYLHKQSFSSDIGPTWKASVVGLFGSLIFGPIEAN